MNKFKKKTSKEIVKSIIELEFSNEDYETLCQMFDEREYMLDALLEKVKDISCKYLCLLSTWNEVDMREHWRDDHARMLCEDKMNAAEADYVMSVVKVALRAIRSKLCDYRDIVR